MARLEGIEFLKDKVISGKGCDLSRPFAFISYAHDDEDENIVRNVFFKLYEKGYNLWIDTANIPKDEYSWKDAAQNALMNDEDTCKLAFYFRSEESLIREPIYDELEMIKELEYIHKIITIDIWHEEGLTVDEYCKQLIKSKRKNDLNICKNICKKVNKDNSAYRLQDVDHSLDVLVKNLEEELKKEGIFPQKKPDETKKAISAGSAEQETIDTKQGGCVREKDTQIPISDGYTYTIFGKEYHAKKREQGKLMYDVFAALIEKYPEKTDILTERTSIARAEDVINPDTQQAKPPYFRACKKFTVGGQDYCVGTSYGFDAKIAEIKGMLKLCGESKEAFRILENKNEFENDEGSKPDMGSKDDATEEIGNETDGISDHISDADKFIYKLWGERHTADKLAEMMHDVFDLIAKRYPDKIEAMAQSNSITAVATKEAVDRGTLPASKLNYFQAKKEHKVGENLYYVSTRYNREQGIGQLKKMLAACEGNSNALVIEAMPQKAQKSVYSSNSVKKDISELM